MQSFGGHVALRRQDKSAARVPVRPTMLILIAHGSRDPRWRTPIEQLTASLQTDLGRDNVRLAYMDLAPPTLADVVADAAARGVTRIRVLPLFLTAAGHVSRDIPQQVDQVRKTHGAIEVELLPAVGQHRLFRQLLYTIAVESAT